MLRRYKIKDYDFRLVVMLVMLSSIGILLVGSAEQSLQRKQMIGVAGGLVLMVIVSLIDFSWLLNFYWLIYIAEILLLVAVRVFGSNKKGASRWIEIGSFQFQPTEICKILLIMFFAMYLMKHEDDLNTLKTILKTLVLVAVPLALVASQPDLKNTLTMAMIFCILIYAAGLSYKIIGGTILVVVPLVAVLLFLIVQTDLPILQEYQKGRIMAALFSEDEEYSDDTLQQDNSVTAIGSGQLTGKGLNNNKVSSANKGNFVAESQNDFIFAVAGEELGFAGSCTILLLLSGIIYECIRMGRRAKDQSGTLICCGVAANVAIQSFINIGVATGLIPNTGTPLPFVSYGLTSLWSLFIGMGLVLNVGLQTRKFIGGKLGNEYRINRA